jgi:hypothetical protein
VYLARAWMSQRASSSASVSSSSSLSEVLLSTAPRCPFFSLQGAPHRMCLHCSHQAMWEQVPATNGKTSES